MRACRAERNKSPCKKIDTALQPSKHAASSDANFYPRQTFCP